MPLHVCNTVIREASLTDLDILCPLFSGYRKFYGQSDDPGMERSFLQARLNAGDSLILLAETPERCVQGFAQMYFLYSSLACKRVLILNDLYVDPAARRLGTGRALVRACCDTAKRLGAARLTLETGVSNIGAQRFYTAMDLMPDQDFVTWHWTP